jgi:hypothetical protein
MQKCCQNTTSVHPVHVVHYDDRYIECYKPGLYMTCFVVAHLEN